MHGLPVYISLAFTLTSILAVFIFTKANSNSKSGIFLFAWLCIQGVISITGFYTVTNDLPPRFILAVLPPFLVIILLFATKKGRLFMDGLDTKLLTLFHVIRVPVEFVLFWLCAYKTIPTLLTFEGRNFDIISGLSAPLVYYFGYIKKRLNRNTLILWNLVCLGLLLNVVFTGVLSVPFPFQQFGFEQPNIALLYFPFTWLPSLVVPMVFFSHLVCLRQLLLSEGHVAEI